MNLNNNHQNKNLWLVGIVFQLVLILFAQLIVFIWQKENLIKQTVAEGQIINFIQGAGVGAVVFALVYFGFNISNSFRQWSRQVVLPMLQQFDSRWLLTMGALAGISEELFFRGALQPMLGITVASLFFGFVHYYGKQELLIYGIMATIMGFVLGFSYIITQSLIVPIVAHSLYNTLVIMALKKGLFK